MSRVVVITGASSGIGAAVARACGARGMRVVLAARRAELLDEVAAAVTAAGGEALACPLDVRVPGDPDRLVARALERFGRIDVMLANAGLGHSGLAARLSDAEIEAVVAVNLVGVIRCARAALPPMLEQRSGHVITVSSVAGGIAMPRAGLYAATKAGVHRFSESLRREVTSHGLFVSDVIPGVVDTPMVANLRTLPKAPVAGLAAAILRLMDHPRPRLIWPGWYGPLIRLNARAPGLVDRLVAWHLRREAPDRN